MRPRKLVKCFLGLGSILVCVVLLGGSKLLFAQTSSGKVQGTVTDPTHAALFDVIITVTNSETGFSRQVESDEYGRFTIGELPPGIYTINAKGEGLKTNEAPRVKLAAAESRTVELVMQMAAERISPLLARPRSLTMAELARTKTDGVSAVEVTDYVYGNYKGPLVPSPPHADLNPRKAYVIFWKDFPYRFVFSHEASYCPWFELMSGAAMCYQFFEGNTGWAELMNQWGRKESSSFVSIIEAGPNRVWVRWTYFAVNIVRGQRALRGTEDFWAYPNGLIVRRQMYETLLPGDFRGYSREPIELIGMCPVGKLWFDVLQKDPSTGENHALAVLDVFSEKRYDVYWKHKPNTLLDSTHRRTGCERQDLENSPGVLMADTMVDGSPFCVFGDASGFRHAYTKLKDHTFVAEIWGSKSWDHWPIGWANSQGHEVDADSLKLYPNGFSTLGMDFFALPDQDEERGAYYSLIGVAGHDLEPARAAARRWLEKGEREIANNPDSGADLPGTFTGDNSAGREIPGLNECGMVSRTKKGEAINARLGVTGTAVGEPVRKEAH